MAARYSNLAKQGKLEQAKQYLLHDIEDTTQYESIQFYNDNTLNACMDSSYDFIGKVVDELQIMHAEAGNPLTKYHIGADETAGAWVESSACEALLKNNVMGISEAEDIAAYFVERVSQLLAKRNIEAAGWNDGMGHTNARRMPEVVQSNAWTPLFWGGHSAAHEQANRGWQLVVSSPDALYFDFPYEADANERGYYWAARRLNSRKVFSMMPENLPAHAEYWLDREENPYVADDTKKLNDDGTIKQQPMAKEFKFYGMQGQLWSETVRTDN
ncbi:family 20 glycosylhydrolase [Psychrosphaera algicola]|uniref:beta-N-acetylhexosaminidase n=1 Tax=Psychrosphaera algicola TaxID=3023714 RepID=A0ABT5FET4_9GAMM|nr:family 20 glycosylhydrolase [Psychrosphaera sp. G1-22]MDC2889539.1 family 20 glycosylhydrolase [Psychrosphaera sp. G1-22]